MPYISWSKENTGRLAQSDLINVRRETFTSGFLIISRLALGLVAVAVLPAAMVTPQQCAACHPAEAKKHAITAHASALLPVPKSAFAIHVLSGPGAGTPLREAPDGYALTYKPSPDGLIAVASRGSDRAQGLIQWVFGSGRRGQTPMIHVGDQYLEHRVSFYAEKGAYGITTGQEGGVSIDATHALGIRQTASDLQSCFACHSTGAFLRPDEFVPGVQCNRCHAGADEHARGHGVPTNPGKLAAPAQVQLCGTCHRVAPQPGHDNEVSNVRFQPLRIMRSRCYLEGQIRCTTCHAAHMDARRDDPAFYNSKCAGCHPHEETHMAAERSDNCIACHMPRSRPHPLLEFTDHFIRVASLSKSPSK